MNKGKGQIRCFNFYTFVVAVALFSTSHLLHAKMEGGRIKLPKQVPYTRQPNRYTCGPASLNSVLLYWNLSSPGVMPLATELHTQGWPIGTQAIELVKAGIAHGLHAQLLEHLSASDLEQMVSNGDTVILRWYPTRVSHYTVLTGIDESSIYMMDPWSHKTETRMPLDTFLDHWHEDEAVAIRFNLN